MKFITNILILIFHESVFAAKPILITYHHHLESALAAKQILEKTKGIPNNLVEIRTSEKPCLVSNQKVMWHLCIDELNQLEEVYADLDFISEGLQIFRNQEKI